MGYVLGIGASNEWAVKSLLVGALPDAVADCALCSVLMVRRYEPTGLCTAPCRRQHQGLDVGGLIASLFESVCK
jgi:hypothetical protein